MDEDKRMMDREWRETVTYVFAGSRETDMPKKTAAAETVASRIGACFGVGTLWQVLPCACASFTCIPFGLMLGWPSPTYPFLINNLTSPIPITMDQSAMIAGFLMIGNTLGTPFSSVTSIGPKYGVLAGLAMMVCGWILMWQARTIYCLLGSRLLVGLGHGFGMGQVKLYISAICSGNLLPVQLKLTNFYTFGGMIAIYIFGPFLEFRNTSMTCLIFSTSLLFFTTFLPSTPTELIKANKFSDAKRLISYIRPHADVDNEFYKLKEDLNNKPQSPGITKLLRTSKLRYNFLIFVTMVFFQQFTGAPATIIYTQILFERSHVPYPVFISIGYISLFFLSNLIGVFIMPKFNKVFILFISCIGTCFTLASKICVIYFQVNEKYWPFASVAVMYLFICVHTIGLGNIPFALMQDLVPKEYHCAVTKFFVMQISVLALIITKIFQVLITQYYLYVPFCMFLGICLVCTLFILVFLPNKTDIKKTQIVNNQIV